METRSTIELLALGVIALLLVASLVGAALRWRYPGSASVANFNSRTAAWWVMVLVLVAAFLLGMNGVVLLFASLSGIALYEFLVLSAGARVDRNTTIAAFLVVLPLHYYLVWSEWYGLFTVFIPVYAFLFLPVISVFRGQATGFLASVSELQWGIMISIFCISHVPALMLLHVRDFEGGNVLLIAFLLLVVQSSDVLQYVWGKLIGRRKIAPSLSPSKTIEGFVGGIVCATALGASLWWITPFSIPQAALIAFSLALLGFAGGLVMSAIKRDRGVKDWGYIIKGHGGVLDRLDSICFSAPIFFHIVRYWWTP
jgi:phosphatidate cytidylyltransferase